MSSTAVLQAPPRAVDTRAQSASNGRPAPGAALGHPRDLIAVPKSGASGRRASNRLIERASAPLGGLKPLRRPKLRASVTDCSAAAERSSGREDRDLGWPRDFDALFEVLENVLGEGSFGLVKAVRHRVTGKRFAVKMLDKQRAKPEDWSRYAEMLRKEVALWTAVQSNGNKHVVQLHQVFEDDKYVYLLQDICEGGDLRSLMKERGTLDEQEAAEAITAVLFMLAACHDRNICYGDVKPANFLLDTHYPCRRHVADSSAPKGNLSVKAVDFGCSQKVDDEGRLNKRTGTPLYMAPEIFFGWYGVEVDIWAAGMMLYQFLAGKLPFFGERADELHKGPKFLIVQALMDNKLDFTGAPWDRVSADAKDLISKMLDVDYNTRISARAALEHPWIQRHSEHPTVVTTRKECVSSNIIDFPASPGTAVVNTSGTDDRKGGQGAT